jgi:hypothetical protein
MLQGSPSVRIHAPRARHLRNDAGAQQSVRIGWGEHDQREPATFRTNERQEITVTYRSSGGCQTIESGGDNEIE